MNRSNWQRALLPAGLMVAGFLLLIAYVSLSRPAAGTIPTIATETVSAPPTAETMPAIATETVPAPPTARLTNTPEPLIPTLPAGQGGTESTAGNDLSINDDPAARLLPTITTSPITDPAMLVRFGVSGNGYDISRIITAGLPIGAYLDWKLSISSADATGAAYWQMVRVSETGLRDDPVFTWDTIETAVGHNPGAVWIVGNEPDVRWQDNVTPESYARRYHDVYNFIKARDPTALIATGGISQPTPLRLAYLDQVLETYKSLYDEPMPVDIWTLHAFILREEEGSWGVGIPPGMDDLASLGILYEIADHNDLAIFTHFLTVFRGWLAERGYQDRPLAITEFGILMPPDYGFPPEIVADYMIGALDIMLTIQAETGYPTDQNRLVQQWFWFIAYTDDSYATGNLYNRSTGELTYAGQVMAAYINGK